MAMSAVEYCSTVCGGKCCILKTVDEGDVRCPNLTVENRCGVYDRRYAGGMPDVVAVGRYTSRVFVDLDGNPAERTFFCGRVGDIIRQGGLPQSVVEQCCFHDPTLLEDR